jgi:hypothetical protein
MEAMLTIPLTVPQLADLLRDTLSDTELAELLNESDLDSFPDYQPSLRK